MNIARDFRKKLFGEKEPKKSVTEVKQGTQVLDEGVTFENLPGSRPWSEAIPLYDKMSAEDMDKGANDYLAKREAEEKAKGEHTYRVRQLNHRNKLRA